MVSPAGAQISRLPLPRQLAYVVVACAVAFLLGALSLDIITVLTATSVIVAAVILAPACPAGRLVVINDTTVLSALVTITVAAIGASTAISSGIPCGPITSAFPAHSAHPPTHLADTPGPWRTEPRMTDTSAPSRMQHPAPAMSTTAVWNERSVAGTPQAMITCTSSKTRAEPRPMREIPMIDFEGDSFHTHEQAVALIATFYKASYSKLLGLVRKRFRSLEAEDMVEELFVKILAQVDASADDPGALGSLMEKWITPAYVFSSLIYLCLDAVGSGPGRWEDATDPQDGAEAAGGEDLCVDPANIDRLGNLLESEPPGLYPHTPDQVAAHLDTLRSRQAVNAILQTLLERGRRGGGHRTHITERQLDIFAALYKSSRPTSEDSTELTDDQLHKLTLGVDKRARARWRDMGGYSDPESGNQSAAAAELGVSRQAVSKSLKGVAAALTITRYIAGVLAPPGNLLNPSAIHAHLDQFDQLRQHADGAAHHAVLTAAAPAVRTTVDRGTRVERALLVNREHGPCNEQVEAVHAAETHVARLTGTSHPNCVDACECHTLQLNRAIEI